MTALAPVADAFEALAVDYRVGDRFTWGDDAVPVDPRAHAIEPCSTPTSDAAPRAGAADYKRPSKRSLRAPLVASQWKVTLKSRFADSGSA